VTLYEQHDLFHALGSSHGASRIVRRAYPDAFYTACMAEAYPLWHELERASGKKILTECGLLYFGHRDSNKLRGVADGLYSLNVPHEVADSVRARHFHPQLKLSQDEIAIWTPEAGWVDAAETLRALHGLATADGLTVRQCQKANPTSLSSEYDVVIVTAGAWTCRYAAIPVKVTVQTFAYVEAQIGGPVWIEDSFDQTYGIPSGKSGLKVGVHRAGYPIDPDQPEREPSEEFLGIIRTTATRRFGIENPVLSAPQGCLYTSTKTEDFVFGRLASNVFFASACSGHGFKMGPWVGRILADFAEGKDEPEKHPRFFWAGSGR
jgi:glycine/D-amino acid oxidase-like deaminating enzyme